MNQPDLPALAQIEPIRVRTFGFWRGGSQSASRASSETKSSGPQTFAAGPGRRDLPSSPRSAGLVVAAATFRALRVATGGRAPAAAEVASAARPPAVAVVPLVVAHGLSWVEEEGREV
jgi:hypothetical protein